MSGLVRDPEGDAELARHLLVAMSSREWESYCSELATEAFKQINKQCPYVWYEVDPGYVDNPESVLTPGSAERKLREITGLSGWKVEFVKRTHSISVGIPEKPRR